MKFKETIENIITEIVIGQTKLQEQELTIKTAQEFLELCGLEKHFKEILEKIKKEDEEEKKKCQQQ